MEPEGRPVLVVQGGPDEDKIIPLSGTVSLGRLPSSGVVVDEDGISRQHAGIRGDTEGYWIADLGSRNGAFVNGESVGTEPRRLRNFDRIELGGINTPVHWVFMESQATVDMPVVKPDES